MAEFKLGRIKFVWKDQWTTGSTYYVDDVVRFGGNTFICVAGHTADADFYTDLNYVPTRWNLVSGGQDWKGVWTLDTDYVIGDIVKYGGLLYVCNTPHTSAATEEIGLEVDLAKWDLFSEGFDWKGDWSTSTRYKKNDIVKYGGITYVCDVYHTSAPDVLSGLETDQAKWNTFNAGIEYKNDWTAATKYKVNDVVKSGAGLWICITNHVAADFTADIGKWQQYVEGLEFESTYSSITTYQPGDVVRYGGNQYVAKQIHSSQNPVTQTAYWDLLSEGFSYRNDWSIGTSYKIREVVKLNGNTYVAKTDAPTTSITVTNSNSTTKRFTTSGSTGSLFAGQAIVFTGTTFGNVLTGAIYYVHTIYSGTQFSVSTTPSGSEYTPFNSSGSMTATAAAMPPNASYWELLTSGMYWRAEWADDVQYYVNDVVRYGANSYICILAHRSEGDDGSTVAAQGGGAANSRPDQDTSGTYWNILTVGDETSVLTTRGDLVYFGGAGPARLPVGVEGQVLRVSANNEPEWATLGHVDHVYFVGTHGTDSPAPVHGMNFDKPWKTIRYACEQVEKGARYPNAQRLLELNRVFIQREVTEWIDYQITYNTTTVPNTSSIWYNFDYDEYKCERDTGFIVDRLIWDIGHGGNLKTLSAALTYINALDGSAGTFSTALDENGTGTYTKLNDEGEQDVLAFNYMLSLVEKVLNNEAPTVNYQVTNGDNSTAVVTQFVDTSLTAESGALTEITSLVGIITTALADGNALNLPDRIVPNNLIQVATGRYREVLPIIVPAETCILGDEVRSTNAGPATGTTPVEDSPYTIRTYGRLEEIIGDIITGTTVTPTTGNSASQSIEVPFATSNERAKAEQLARVLQDNIDFRLGTITTFDYPEPTDYNTAFLQGYKDSRDLLLANKAFFQQQVKAYINTNYPTLFYSRTACLRDVGYLVDALVYDLTYGGYSQSLNAALAYYQGVGSSLYIDSTEKQATLASYTYLKGMMELAANNTIVPSLQTVETQVFGTAGSAASITAIGNNMDIIYDVVDGGLDFVPNVTVTTIASNVCTTSASHNLQAGDTFTPRTTTKGFIGGRKYYIKTTPAGNTFTVSESLNGTTTSLTDGTSLNIVGDVVDNPTMSWAPSAMVTAFETLTTATSDIKINTIDFINSNYGDFIYDSSKCRRDTGYIIDGAYYDAALGTNYNGVINGISYRRAMANLVVENQLAQTIGSLEYARTLIESSLSSNTTAQTRASTSLEEGFTIIEFGTDSIPALTWTDPGVDANKRYAREQLQTNRAFIISELSTWISTTYPSLWATINQTLCQRDIGYIVDAFSYDVQYGGNTATRRAAQAYFDGAVSVLPAGQKAASAATMTQLGSICSQIVQETYAGQNTSGTAATGTEGTQMTTFAGYIQAVITADSLSGLVAESLPSISWASAGIQTAVAQLAEDKTDIVADTLQYITTNYNSFVYNHSKCSRDVGIIIDAVGYDMIFGGNFQTMKAAYSYLRETATEVFDLNQKNVTRDALVYVRDQALDNVGGDTDAQAEITRLMQIIDDVIFMATNEGQVCQSEARTVDYAVLQLERNRDFIIAELSAWMEYNYVNFDNYYNSSTCARDIGYIVDAVISDLATGSNFASSVAGESYYRSQAALVPGAQMMQTVAAVKEAKRLASGYVTSNTLYSTVNAAFDNVIAILEGGLTAVPTYTWPDNGTSTATTVSDAALLQTNRATMVSSINSWLLAHGTYGAMYTALSADQKLKCQRDVGYMIDAVSYDLQYGGNMQSTIAGSAYYSFGTLQIAGTEKAASVATLTELATLMKAYTSAGGDTTVDTLTTLIAGIINSGATEPMSYTMPSVAGESAAKQATHLALGTTNITAIKTGVTTYITDEFSSFTYNVSMCERDVARVIDAIKWDLKYSSNYKTLLCSRYYSNSVKGSLEEDMYYVRNGTGIRNQTLQGLSGDLTPANEYGTRRVTAGAYVSLDPGWGPDDFRTWILSRSPYVQNCTTFGYAAIGQKIDGALHNGGGDSIVSNDFTQLISDGIGAWVTNNGRAELVSVFTYYSHIGYLSEAGGRIRGTNGNNSYGDFGSVAEGYDVTETPNTAIVDNKFQSKAIVGEIFTTGDEIIAFHFDSAGNDYTEATWIISGPGTGTEIVQDEFRDGAVFNVFLQDFVDDSTNAPEATGNFGGFGYVSNSNTAQGGTTTSVTIAATDPEISSAYIGMKIYLTGGTGAGQYGIITAYNSGTKIAAVKKESDDTPGWDHLIAGTAISAPDASTTYTIEPRITFSAPTYSSSTMTLPSSGTWSTVVYGDTTATYTLLDGTYIGDGLGAMWQVIRNGWKYTVTNTSAGTGYSRFDTITINGTDLGGVDVTNDILITITSVNTTTGAIQAFEVEGYGVGGKYVALRSGSQAGAYSTDGTSWTANATLMPSAANWSAAAYGLLDDGSSISKFSKFVAVATGSTSAAYSNDGVTWVASTLPASRNWTGVAFGVDRFVAVASNLTTTAVTLDGEVWDITGTTVSTGYVDITYGKKLFVAITSGGTISTSADGVTWTDTASLGAGTWKSITYGNNKFIAVASDSNTGAYSIDGTTWTSMTIGSADGSTVGGYQQVRYGQGVYVITAYQSGSQDYSFIMSSEDGLYWTSKGVSAPDNSISGYGPLAFGTAQRTGRWVVLNKDVGTHAATIRNGCRAKARSFVAEEKIYAIRMVEPGSGYDTAPTITITDPNNIYEAPALVRIGNGALAYPTFVDRGTGYVSGAAEIDQGDGYGNFLQDGQYVAVRRLSQRPVAGSNVVFGHLPNQTFKLVNVYTFLGQYDGSYTAFFQISPPMKTFNVPDHGTSVTTRIRYSQVRLTGHDFLDIGTGNFDETNYPGGVPDQPPTQANETVENNGGRVFFTSTDQDGNFRVGDLFTIEQSTGIATLNADAFNIAGLQELTLGEVTLGGGSASITEFSTDPFFTQDSDNVVPTQRAIKAYISAQIGGGGASLNVNSVTAGFIYIAGSQITTTTGATISVKAKMNFKRSLSGMPVAWHYFLK